jgi:hypothetical protein
MPRRQRLDSHLEEERDEQRLAVSHRSCRPGPVDLRRNRVCASPPIAVQRNGHRYSEDFGLLKRVSAGSERSIEFRADFINALNRSGLAGPNTDLASADFGKIFGVAQGPRRIQLSLRGTF